MSYPVKPGDTFTAKAIGTYPELPDWSLDDPGFDPQFCAVRQFDDLPEGVHDLITYTGPKGTVVVAYGEEGFVHYADQFGGTVLRHVVWDAASMTWKAAA